MEKEIRRYTGFKTFVQLREFMIKLKEQLSDKFIYLGSGWNKENKHFFDIEINKELIK